MATKKGFTQSRLASWRTTLAGVVVFLQALGTAALAFLDDDPTTTPDWNLVITAFFAFLGFLMARDNSVSSETVGAK
jgi:hypothetical protein